MSDTVISAARLQSAFKMALTSASRSGWTVPRLAPTTSWPSVLLSMPMRSGEEMPMVPSSSVVWAEPLNVQADGRQQAC